MKIYLLSLAVLLAAAALPVQAQLVLDWEAFYASPGDSADVAKDMVLDGSGNVIITGFSWNGADQRDLRTVKFDSTGQSVWSMGYNQASGAWDEGEAVGLDNSGNIYVAGFSRTAAGDDDYLTVKYDSNGNQLWAMTYDSPYGGDDHVTDLTVDGDGNVIVTGYSGDAAGTTDYATVKYSPTGQQLWAMRYDGTASWYDKAWAITTDDDGYVYVTGGSDQVPGTTTEFDYLTIKYDPEGNQLWTAPWDGFGSHQDDGLAIVVDAAGYVYVTGTSNGDYTTIRYESGGNQDWVQIYNGPQGMKDKAFAIALDPDGNVIVTGGSRAADTTYDFATLKYTAGGVELWRRWYNGPGLFDDEAKSMAVDDDGNIYVSGYSWGSSFDFATVKYLPDGAEDWVVRYDGPAQDYDYPYATALDALGRIYVSGFATANATGKDMATVRFSPAAYAMNIDLTYVSGSPVPAGGGNLVFDVFLQNEGIATLAFDAWIDISYQGGATTTVVLRSFEGFQPGWTVDRSDVFFPIPASYAAGNYLLTGNAGRAPDEVWDASSFPFQKQGVQTGGTYQPEPLAGLQDPFTASYGRGITVPEAMILTSVYPNPFNPTTVLSFELRVARYVTLTVYDVAGREVAMLVDGVRDAGMHEVAFDGSHLSSGMYFYRLTAGDFSGVGKMALLK